MIKLNLSIIFIASLFVIGLVSILGLATGMWIL